jgi:hypothetical protein|tara:strand:- start:554 stop:697 length:144 start_codon:yes stop_codon:yes gene_type:complete
MFHFFLKLLTKSVIVDLTRREGLKKGGSLIKTKEGYLSLPLEVEWVK